jgi:uncharacterized membrane protein
MATPAASRLAYLDFLRGLAGAIMIVGHTFHSFTHADLRNGAPYVLSQFAGGLPPAIFLFLTGITLAFRLDSAERKLVSTQGRISGALRRAGYLLLVAYVFRVQLWLFSWPGSHWADMLKVDILNCMALAIVVASPMAVFRTPERVRLCAVLGTAVACASPTISQINWSGVPPLIRNYLVPDYNYFSFFPWASFLIFGVSAGSALRLISDDRMDRAMQWAAILGGALIVGARFFSDLPYSFYAKSDFWLDSPGLVFIKLGVVLWALSLSYVWVMYVAAPGWSWIRQIGTTSLLVYWVHIEIVYGRWLNFWQNRLDTPQTVVLTVVILALMVGLSAGKNWFATRRGKGVPAPVLAPAFIRVWKEKP